MVRVEQQTTKSISLISLIENRICIVLFIRGDSDISVDQRLQWALQITSALYFIHSHSVIHGDLCLNSIFLSADLDTKLADFGGSSIDGSDLLVWRANIWDCTLFSHSYVKNYPLYVFSLGPCCLC
jgi:serine/threonine protein kinase